MTFELSHLIDIDRPPRPTLALWSASSIRLFMRAVEKWELKYQRTTSNGSTHSTRTPAEGKLFSVS